MSSIMQQEAMTAPEIVMRQLTENMSVINDLVAHLQKKPPTFAFTIARGSSDHAASFGQYLFSTQANLFTASMPPSISSIYHTKLNVRNALAIAISQSGASPDICSTLQAAKEAGATTVAIVNTTDSLLANIADFVIPLHAGKEHAVAATKSYIASLSALLQLVAHFSQNKELIRSLPLLPECLQQAAQVQWPDAITQLKDTANLIVMARGIGFPIAQEAALKFKETANMHAEAFSSAEFQHGPMALARPDFPLIFFTQQDAALPSLLAMCARMTRLGTKTFLTYNGKQALEENVAQHVLMLPTSPTPSFDPIMTIQAFYPMMATLALERGYNPDAPDNLRKVTETH